MKPSLCELNQTFYLCGEDVRWKLRDRCCFISDTTYKAFLNNKLDRLVLGTPDKHGYFCIQFALLGVQYEIQLHRLKMLLKHQKDTVLVVDHIDRDVNNNLFSNLRFTSRKVNALNTKQLSNKNTPKGIYKTKTGWMISRGVFGNKRESFFCSAVKTRLRYLKNELV